MRRRLSGNFFSLLGTLRAKLAESEAKATIEEILFTEEKRVVANALASTEIMKHCTVVWKTDRAAVAVCPCFLHFYVWTSLVEVPVRIKADEETISDFEETVWPLIDEHSCASTEYDLAESRVRQQDTLHLMHLAAEDDIRGMAEVMSSPRVEGTELKELHAFHAQVIEALEAFIRRHNEPVEA